MAGGKPHRRGVVRERAAGHAVQPSAVHRLCRHVPARKPAALQIGGRGGGKPRAACAGERDVAQPHIGGAACRVRQCVHRHRRGKYRAAAPQLHRTGDMDRPVIGDVRQRDLHRGVGVVLPGDVVQQRLQFRGGVHGRVLPVKGHHLLHGVFHRLPQLDGVAVFHRQRPHDLVVGAGAVCGQHPEQQRPGVGPVIAGLLQFDPPRGAVRRRHRYRPVLHQRRKRLVGGLPRYRVRDEHRGGLIVMQPGGDQLRVVPHGIGAALSLGREGRVDVILPPVRTGIVGLAGSKIRIDGLYRRFACRRCLRRCRVLPQRQRQADGRRQRQTRRRERPPASAPRHGHGLPLQLRGGAMGTEGRTLRQRRAAVDAEVVMLLGHRAFRSSCTD